MNLKKLNKIKAKRFTKWYFPIFLISWLAWGVSRFLQDPNPKIHQAHWGEQISYLILLVMVTTILIMIVFKISRWKTDPENPQVQVKEGMKIFDH